MYLTHFIINMMYSLYPCEFWHVLANVPATTLALTMNVPHF